MAKSSGLKWLQRDRLFNLSVLQWALPIFLSITAIAFELIEHGTEGERYRGVGFTSEVIIFGLMGPLIIGFVIAWMRELVNAEKRAREEVHALNRQLEARVAERTAALEQRNAELDRANQQLKQLDEMKSEFVSLVSHELRAPLTALNGGLELVLQSAESLPAATRRTLEAMMDESARLTRFVQTILDVSRLEAGRLTLNPGPVAIVPVLYRSVEMLYGNRRHVEWALPTAIPPIWADEVHCEQIIRNLLLNADQYSPPEQPIEISVQVLARHVSVQVADHGKGISPQVQSRIFERFQRGEEGESAPPGWGLGLYFAKKLTEAQNGTLTVRSPCWEDAFAPGAAFVVTLPIAAESPDENEGEEESDHVQNSAG